MSILLKIVYPILCLICCYSLSAQHIKNLTLNEAIKNALKKSYKVRSYNENKIAMEENYRYNQTQFKPRLDLSLFAPRWDEMVTPIQRSDSLPVYNSIGSIQFGGVLKFTYMLPTGGSVSLSGTTFKEDLSTILALENYRKISSSQVYSQLALILEQPIFTTNILKENLSEAKYNYEKSQFYFERAQLDIIYEVTYSYYSLYRVTYERQIAYDKMLNSEEAYRVSKLKVESGRIPEGDLLIAEVELAQNKAKLSETANNLVRIKENFKHLIGYDINEEFEIITDLQYKVFPIDLKIAVQRGIENSLEIKQGKLNIRLQEIELDRAEREREFRGNIYAYYDLTGVSTEYGNISDLYRSSFRNVLERPPNRGITLSFSYPLFDWGRGSAKIQQEQAILRSEKLDIAEYETKIKLEIHDLFRTIEDTKNRMKIYEKYNDVVKRSYNISIKRFENGDITNQELALEQTRLAESKMAYLDAFITYQLTIADLVRKTMWNFESNSPYDKEIQYLMQ